MTRGRLAVLLALVVGSGAAACSSFGRIIHASVTPRDVFADEATPTAPDYGDPTEWSALPERVDAGDPLPSGVSGVDQQKAPVDVFYLHPTSYVGRGWNGPVDDPDLNETTDRVATGIQAPAFNGCCAVYAPRYRQANLTTLTTPSPDGDRALDLAYGDVERAFAAFQARRGPDRPFVLAGHSQGSVLLERLLFEHIAGTPLAERLVVAVLPGGSVTAEGLRERGIPACAAPDELGCVVAWNARGPRFESGGRFELRRPDTRELLCTNPLSWRTDAEPAPIEANLGAVFLEHRDTAPRPAFADATCEGGRLVVREVGKAPRDLPSRILDGVIGPENHHPIEYQMYFMNLRENVDRRVAAWLADESRP